MSAKVARAAEAGQPEAVDRRDAHRSTDVDRAPAGGSMRVDQRALLKACVVKRGYTAEALGAAMRKDGSYAWKVLSGEKPLSFDFLNELPDDVLDLYFTERLESRGAVVVTPVDDAEQAMRFVVRGLLGMFGPVSRGASVRKAMARAGLR